MINSSFFLDELKALVQKWAGKENTKELCNYVQKELATVNILYLNTIIPYNGATYILQTCKHFL